MRAGTGPTRVMIVEDSPVVRRLLTHIVSRDPRLQVVAAVESGEEALAELDRVRPQVISMDIRLPGMDGLEAIGRIMAQRPTPIVVVADAVEDASLRISLNALREGALSVVEKPVAPTNASYEAVANTICTQLAIMADVPVIRRRSFAQRPQPVQRPLQPDPEALQVPTVVGIGASTGGPPALARLIGALPRSFPVPILVVQHMGASFMEGFAAWLDGQVELDVRLARSDEVAVPGRVYVAPGDRQLTVAPGNVLKVSADPPVGGQRPSATALFSSLARAAAGRAAGVLLTGMGEDGAAGLLEIRRAGGFTITEDESTAVVYGMPAAAVKLGASRIALPLDLIAPRLLRLVPGGGR
ncbi:chemotaxis-specific protein-glutamate methyltransferase CheB [Chthonobacter albigriseus]|uniref:chemotaxis-specific protein-glutamate methyltransferase CheB n=1 Tax=Chthonobacter albigriseus TaxID=1683161 RepID=UPI001FCE3D7D|nr:chemotaxis-specific protein-glutamate methyltransferase CheB [Chthonobacter albigriseus]